MTTSEIQKLIRERFSTNLIASVEIAKNIYASRVDVYIEPGPEFSDQTQIALERILRTYLQIGMSYNIEEVVEKATFVEKCYKITGGFPSGVSKTRPVLRVGDIFRVGDLSPATRKRIGDLIDRGIVEEVSESTYHEHYVDKYIWPDGEWQSIRNMSLREYAVLGSIAGNYKPRYEGWRANRPAGYEPYTFYQEIMDHAVRGERGRAIEHPDSILAARAWARSSSRTEPALADAAKVLTKALRDATKVLDASKLQENDARQRIAKRLGVDPRYVTDEQVAYELAPKKKAYVAQSFSDPATFGHDVRGYIQNRYGVSSRVKRDHQRDAWEVLWDPMPGATTSVELRDGVWRHKPEDSFATLAEACDSADENFKRVYAEQFPSEPENQEAAPRPVRYIGTGDMRTLR